MSGSPEPGATLGPRHYLAMLADCPYLFVGDAGSRGLGVFTARPIRAGGVIVADEDGSMRGRALSLAAAVAQGWDRQRHLFQLDYNLFLPPRGCFDNLFNHSCQPSGGWRITVTGAQFVAIRDIAAGEEITYDYSCHLLSPDERMVCVCETPSCRGEIGPFVHLPKVLQDSYRRLDAVTGLRRR